MGKLNVSFGICIAPDYNKEYLFKLLKSIHDQLIDQSNYEILIIGDYKNDIDLTLNTRHVMFDESVKRGWITRKKNILVSESKFDNVCLLHEYYILYHNWYKGLLEYNNQNPNWNILMNRVLRYEGDRHSDWLVNQKYMDVVLSRYPNLQYELMMNSPLERNGPRWICGLPYSEMSLKHLQYISGGYILAKKKVLTEVPLDDNLVWGQAEDIAWSESLIQKNYRFDFNPYSDVFIQKPNKWRVYQMTDKCVECLKEIFGNE